MKIEKLKIEGTEIDYFTTGKGKDTLVFFPGVGSDCRLWETVTDELKSRYKIYSFSLPNYSSKSGKGKRFNIFTAHLFLKKYIEHFSIKNPVLIGHSLGGLSSLFYTHKYPKKVSKLIMVSTPVKPKKIRLPRSWQMGLDIANRNKGLQVIVDYLIHNPSVHAVFVSLLSPNQTKYMDINVAFDMMKEKGIKNIINCYNDILDTDIQKVVREISVPSLFVYGTKDRSLAKVGVPKTVVDGNTSIIVSSFDTNHYIPEEKPLEVAKLINAFIKN